jgi:GT2 family glycosyltransferase
VTTAVITVVHGRHSRLATQELMLRRSTVRPEVRVVVAVDDPDIASLVDDSVRLVSIAGQPGGLPIGAARNAGAAQAVDAGCDLLVFLDVDCLPSAGLVAGYQAAAAATGDDALLCGPVAYLPPPPRGGYDLNSLGDHPFHPARPVPAPGELRRDGDHRLFWSLSFAVTATCWQRLGGFCERYVGYGAEDTDLAMIADRNHVGVTWVGDAAAYHQWHSTAQPPLQHLDDILRNGAIFAERWGWWPMEGWLQQFAELGLVEQIDDGWARPAADSSAVVGA